MTPELPLSEELLPAVGTAATAELLDSSPRSHVWRVRTADGRLVVV
ncbi:hypothetical protein [Streptomyces sp. SPB074]|nr:hypothetical protein [Streptomyces sp. SPB074]